MVAPYMDIAFLMPKPIPSEITPATVIFRCASIAR